MQPPVATMNSSGETSASTPRRQPAADVIEAEVVTSDGAAPAADPPLNVPPDPPATAAANQSSLALAGATWRGIGGMAEWLFGVVSLIAFLAMLATVPLLQLMSLGYLLEVSGRIARTRRLAAGFVGIRKAARLGGAVLGAWLAMLPVRFSAELWSRARLIDPESAATANLRGLTILLAVLLTLHVAWAWFRGGRLRHFLWPAPIRFWRRIRQGGMYVEARDRLWNFVAGLRLPYYFSLGLRGFLGTLAWLAIPVGVLAAASQTEGEAAGGVALIGGLALAWVVLYLPFLQAHFAAENRWRALFELGRVRALFRAAPIAFWFALLITLSFSVPLFLLKIELTPREVAWLPAVLFVVFSFPARLLAGWAVARAARREQPRWFISRWAARLAALPVALLYALIVFASQYTSWYGAVSLYEQHAFLVPVPFVSL